MTDMGFTVHIVDGSTNFGVNLLRSWVNLLLME